MKTGSEILITCYRNLYKNGYINDESLKIMVQKEQITEDEKELIMSDV